VGQVTTNVQVMEGLEIDVIHPRDTVVAVIEAATTGTAGGTTARTEEAEGTINRNPKGHEEMTWTRVAAPA